MTISSNQDHYYNGINKFSSKYSPVTQSEAAESKEIKCEDTVTRFIQCKCNEPKATQYTIAYSTAAEFDDASFKVVDSKGAKYNDIGCNSTEYKGFESDTADYFYNYRVQGCVPYG